jgi:acyl carrier protein
MTTTEVLARIGRSINEVRANKGLNSITLTENISLLGGDTGIDSLDLAALVVELQDENEYDPFQEGFVNFNTAGELASLFADGRK